MLLFSLGLLSLKAKHSSWMHIDERPARDGTSCVNSCARPQVAKSIAFLLSEEHAAMVHGAQLPIDGGFWVS